ncbi:Long-chain acyl-CoA synthetases (AMP-forming) [Ceraceosorus bombacis]|uniref:Long-chain acyl-CoA synthetases (AMP-forming) n=1 Tax=Ceraceosorus bombacis TaxID=401625 RepID=A0A0P1BFV2_9BASI|nr:Long-chain acyl-CoA synthetases (AMP-forming) [Ceraceosorus bombacis]
MVISTFPEPPKVWPLDVQAVPVPGTEKDGHTPIFRNAAVPEFTTQESMYDVFAVGRDRDPQAPYLGIRPWNPAKKDFERRFEWLTYAQAEELRTAVGSALGKLAKEGQLGQGVPDKQWTCGAWMQNRPEFQILEHAAAAYSRRTVSLYDSYDTETAVYVLAHSEARCVFTTTSHVPTLLANASEIPLVKLIVTLDTPAPTASAPGELGRDQLLAKWAASKGVNLTSWDKIVELGKANLVAHTPPQSNEEQISFCYTSGTTGKPKAAIVLHKQLAYAGAATSLYWSKPQKMISYLPLAHIYERILEALVTRNGGSIGYFSGDVLRLTEDAQVLQPSFFPGVPRVFNRIAAQIQAQADGGGLKGKLLTAALNAKIARHDQTGDVTHAFYDRIVFRKVRAVLGGKVEQLVSGSAPIRPDVLKVLRVALSADFREGYGQTENAGSCLLMHPGDKDLGTCGPPVPGHEVRLRDCPELGYTTKDKPFARGEILSRGQSVFPGYFKDDKKSRETLDEEGWMYTGDVGLIDDKGRVKIIDRVKNLIKLAQGEYVAIEHVEGIFSSSKLAAQLWLYGDSTEAHLVAIAVPDPEAFAPFASKITGKQLSAADLQGLEQACQDPKVVASFLNDLVTVGRRNKVKGFEFPRALKLRMTPFSIEEGTLTPTFKLKRPEARKILEADIKALYSKPPADISASKL